MRIKVSNNKKHSQCDNNAVWVWPELTWVRMSFNSSNAIVVGFMCLVLSTKQYQIYRKRALCIHFKLLVHRVTNHRNSHHLSFPIIRVYYPEIAINIHEHIKHFNVFVYIYRYSTVIKMVWGIRSCNTSWITMANVTRTTITTRTGFTTNGSKLSENVNPTRYRCDSKCTPLFLFLYPCDIFNFTAITVDIVVPLLSP